jgi:uncharacterized protein DUF4360
MGRILASAGSAAVVALVALVATAPAARADTGSVVPPGGQVTLSVQTINGSGCPAGTAKVAMQSDNTGFRVIYSDFLAQVNGGASPTAIRKNCQVNVQINIPQGFTFAIAWANYRGHASLASGASALERTNYYFQGTSGNNFVDHTLSGPYSGSWTATDITAAEDLVYEPCGQSVNLNLNTELRVDAGGSSSTSWISMDASDGGIATLVHFQWEQC